MKSEGLVHSLGCSWVSLMLKALFLSAETLGLCWLAPGQAPLGILLLGHLFTLLSL